MAAAIPQPHITLNQFRGKTNENWPNFERVLRSLLIAGNNPIFNRPQFLQLHLPDQARQFFKILSKATRDDFHAALMALRNRYSNPNLPKLHKLHFHNLTLDHKNGSPEDLLV